MRSGSALAALLLVLGVTGCGGTGSAPRDSGRVLFAQACSGCHTLTGRETPNHQGGDLLRVRLSRPVSLEFAREMPVRRPLSQPELAAIVDYIATVRREAH